MYWSIVVIALMNSKYCGNLLESLIKGKCIGQEERISSEQLFELLDDLSREHQNCVKLAFYTLYKVINDYHRKRRK